MSGGGRGRARWGAGRAPALVCLLALALTPSTASSQSSIRAEVDTTVVTIGDRITLTITVDHPAASRATLPDSLDVAPFEVLDARALPVETTGAEASSTFELTLTAFELGELEIPPVPVRVVAADDSVETLETDRFGIDVVSVGVDETGDIRGIRGPLGIPISSWVLALWVLIPLVAAALLYVLVRRLRPRGEETPRPALGPLARPPHEVALEALAALEASDLLERGHVKEYHIAASDILRTYVEERFRVDALEMTTREVLDGLGAVGADASFRVGLRTFLDACDLVKFAKARPGADESRAALELGRRIIRESIPAHPREPGPDSDEGGRPSVRTAEADERDAALTAASEGEPRPD